MLKQTAIMRCINPVVLICQIPIIENIWANFLHVTPLCENQKNITLKQMVAIIAQTLVIHNNN